MEMMIVTSVRCVDYEEDDAEDCANALPQQHLKEFYKKQQQQQQMNVQLLQQQRSKKVEEVSVPLVYFFISSRFRTSRVFLSRKEHWTERIF